jgi:hypothetical protein
MRAVAGNFLGASATLVNIKVRGITPRTQKLFGQLDRVGCRCGGTQRQPEKGEEDFHDTTRTVSLQCVLRSELNKSVKGSHHRVPLRPLERRRSQFVSIYTPVHRRLARCAGRAPQSCAEAGCSTHRWRATMARASASTRVDLTCAETRDYRTDAKQVIRRKNMKTGLVSLAMAYAMTASLVPVHAVPGICIDPAGKTDEEINRLYTAEDTPCPLDRPPIGYHGYEGQGGKVYYLISRDHRDAIPFDNLHTCMLATTIEHRKNSFCVADPDNNKKKKK